MDTSNHEKVPIRDFETWYVPRMLKKAKRAYEKYECDKYGIDFEDVEQQAYLLCLETVQKHSGRVAPGIITMLSEHRLGTYLRATIAEKVNFPKSNIEQFICSDWEDTLYLEMDINYMLKDMLTEKWPVKVWTPKRGVELIMLRYGLWDGVIHTREYIGNRRNVSDSVIEQQEHKMLRRLHKRARLRELEVYLGD